MLKRESDVSALVLLNLDKVTKRSFFLVDTNKEFVDDSVDGGVDGGVAGAETNVALPFNAVCRGCSVVVICESERELVAVEIGRGNDCVILVIVGSLKLSDDVTTVVFRIKSVAGNGVVMVSELAADLVVVC